MYFYAVSFVILTCFSFSLKETSRLDLAAYSPYHRLMRLRLRLHRIAVVLLAVFLSACTTPNLFSELSGGGNPSAGYNQRTARLAASKDNPASQDYFNDQSNNLNSNSNLWVAIRKNFKIKHDASNPEVQTQIIWFEHNQKYLDRTARRAAPYMYYIYQQVKVRNLPSELVLLPIMESAYNPFASSYAGAAGLWQLIPGTARNFGVRQDWWYDGRRDITASTKAALDYFSYLQNFFDGNWLLAIAAYNTGQGNVQAAIRHNARLGLSTSFWNLPLPNETKAYVPRLLALAAIVDNPTKYGIILPPISNSAYLGEVEISAQITLARAADLAGISVNELKILNPGYQRKTLDPNQPYKILLPIDKINTFRENLLKGSSRGSGLWGRYTVEPNDTWKQISTQFNTPVALLQKINNLSSATPPVNQVLLIPENAQNESAIANTAITHDANTNADTDTDTNTIAKPNLSDAADLDKSEMQQVQKHNTEKSSRAIKSTKIIHTVRPGEDLYRIAHLYHVSVKDLEHWNHLSQHAAVKTGKKLIIYKKFFIHNHTKKHIKTYIKKYKTYIIKHGDTLDSIAHKFHVKSASLKTWNKIRKPSDLKIGKKLIIY